MNQSRCPDKIDIFGIIFIIILLLGVMFMVVLVSIGIDKAQKCEEKFGGIFRLGECCYVKDSNSECFNVWTEWEDNYK